MPEKTSTIDEELKTFLHDIDALTLTIPAATVILDRVLSSLIEKHNAAVGRYNDILDQPVESNGGRRLEDYLDMERQKKAISAVKHTINVMPTSLIVSLVSRFDAYLAALIRFLVTAKPNIINQSEKPIKFNQLLDFKTLEDAREYVIEREIENVLRDSHKDQFVWLERNADVPLRKDLPSWKPFIELTERRNLFVHTDGVISSQYLKVCSEEQCTLEEDAKLGRKLGASPKYCNDVRDCLYEIATKLTHVIWRKHKKDNISVELADRTLTNIIMGLLENERFKLAQCLLDFAVKCCKFVDDESKRYFVVNRAQAYKWQGDNKTAREILDSEDWSATSDKFRLVSAVLKDEYETACTIMKKIGVNDELPQQAYHVWPVFREFLKTPEFLKTYAAVFSEDFRQGPIKPEQDDIEPLESPLNKPQE